MYFYIEKIQEIVVFLTVILSCIVVADESIEEKSLKLKLGLDSILETNGTSLLQIKNFKGSEPLKKLEDKTLSRRSVRAESSSESEEDVDDKDKKEKNDNAGQARQSDLSDDAESSDSDGDRRLSTKGLSPDDFEPESNPSIHDRNSKDSASE